MRYPKLKEPNTSRQVVDTFRGYNHNLRLADGEFFEMKNMTSDHYPVLAPRGKRGVYAQPQAPQGIIAKNALCYVDGADFVLGNRHVELGLSEREEDCPKQLVSMGAYVIILPDKKFVNTIDADDCGDIEAEYHAAGSAVSLSPCAITGESYLTANVSPTAPEDPENLALWVDTNNEPHVLKRYSATSEMWVSVASTYVKISAPGIGKNFQKYDGVTISGIQGEGLDTLNGSTVIWGCEEDCIIIPGLVDGLYLQVDAPTLGRDETTDITIARKVPEMDFVIESGNRLWGCRYGLSADGEMVNEIYASKLGDFRNWNCFMGLSTDSYRASCGTDGPFTGAFTLDHPLFFKENFIHKVYGTFPSNFQIQATACRGVQSGCHRSLAAVNGTLFYKSPGAVCAYDGSLPGEVSYALGNTAYSDAVGGAFGGKYYISMKDAAEQWHLFVYDKGKGLWHREDNLRADGFAAFAGELFALEHDTGKIIAMLGSGEPGESRVSWMVQTGPVGADMPDQKYIAALTVRMSLELGARVRFLVQYDSMGGWEGLGTMTGRSLRSFSVPIRPRRCDHFRLRIEGDGDAKIYAITKSIEQGSDIP